MSEALVFASPSRDSEVLFRLIEGDELIILSRTDADALNTVWYQVGQGQRYGWVAGSQVTTRGDVELAVLLPLQTPSAVVSTSDSTRPPADLATPTATLEDPTARVAVPELVVFELPDRTSGERLRLQSGDQAELLGRTAPDAEGEHYYLLARDGNILGWALATELELRGAVERVLVVEDAVDVALSALLPSEVAPLTLTTP
ncbi:MAG: SH3 domain-containing protein [Anaerolineae bacterium]|nr:SH3 domain-containing protein [Anaerolineae bacterium]